MSMTIRRWGFVIPRLHWARRARTPLESMPMEQIARAFPQWGSAEVRSSSTDKPGWEGVFTYDDMLLMERMGRVR